MQNYELEMFYGDDTWEDLIKSSKVLIKGFYDYEDKYYNLNEEGTILNDRTEEEEESPS